MRMVSHWQSLHQLSASLSAITKCLEFLNKKHDGYLHLHSQRYIFGFLLKKKLFSRCFLFCTHFIYC